MAVIIRRNQAIHRGTVQSFVRANGGWMAVVTAHTSGPREPVVSRLIPIECLTGSARKKADRWLAWLA